MKVYLLSRGNAQPKAFSSKEKRDEIQKKWVDVGIYLCPDEVEVDNEQYFVVRAYQLYSYENGTIQIFCKQTMVEHPNRTYKVRSHDENGVAIEVYNLFPQQVFEVMRSYFPCINGDTPVKVWDYRIATSVKNFLDVL